MQFFPEKLDQYVCHYTSPEDEVLKSLNRETNLKVLLPQMLSGHLQGRVLSMLSHMIKPKRILEVGTYTGYSAICMAEGLAPDGKLITLDINEEIEDMVRSYFKKSPYAEKIDYRLGNALDIIPQLQDEFDLVFIDADKLNYSNYFDLVIDKVRQGGFILADNVLWSGKVTDKMKDKETAALDAYNEKIHSDARVENVILTVRDGIMMARKK